MKKVLTVLIALSVVFLKPPVFANDEAFSECEYGANSGYEKCDAPLGSGSNKATSATINASMVGWGLGLAIAIAIVAGVIHQSAATHGSTNSSSSSSSSSTTQ